MTQLVKRIASAWHRHSFLGVVHLVFKNLARLLQPHRRMRGKTEIHAFDTVYGTETSAIREVGTLDITSANARHAVRYEPSPEALVRQAIAILGIEPAAFTFIDFGSGKGRVLMIAAEYSFKRLIGIEFSSELNEIAKHNIARLPSNLNLVDRVSLLCYDAAEFDLPLTDLVCYFYNPFRAAVLGPIVDKLATRATEGHRIIIIYVDPQYRDLFEQTGTFRILHSQPSLLVLST